MKRRDFLTLAAAAATASAWPLAGLAQQAAKVPRVALVSGATPVTDMVLNGDPSWAALIDELARRGFVEGQTVTLERYAANVQSAPQVGAIVVASSPDVVFANGSQAALGVANLSKAIPIVVVNGDPVGSGLVTNLARPEGNVTAVAASEGAVAEAKNLDLLLQASPAAKQVAYYGPGVGGQPDAGTVNFFKAARQAAASHGVALSEIVVENPANDAEYRRAFAAAIATTPDVLQIGAGTVTSTGSALLGQLALMARIPAISPYDPFCRSGGLMSYGTNGPATYRQAAGYIALILKGAKPADLPVLQPTVFDFVINLKTAKAIGVTIPQTLLVQATEVIQ